MKEKKSFGKKKKCLFNSKCKKLQKIIIVYRAMVHVLITFR